MKNKNKGNKNKKKKKKKETTLEAHKSMEKSSDDGDSEFERIQQEDQLASSVLAAIVDDINEGCAKDLGKRYVGIYQAFITGFSEFYTLKEMEIYMVSENDMPVEYVKKTFDKLLPPNSWARTAYLKRALRCKADRDRKAKEEATAHSSGIPPVTEQNEKEASEDSEIEVHSSDTDRETEPKEEEDSEQKETALDVHTSDQLEAFPSSRRPPVTEQIEAGTEDQSSDTDRETEPKEEEASEPKSLTVPEKKKKKKKETTLEAHKSVRPPGTEQIDAEASQVLSSDSPSETEQKEAAPEVNSFDQKESSPVVYNSDGPRPRVEEQEVAGLAVLSSDRPHRVSADSVSALVQDLFTFQITSKVHEGLGSWVVSSQKDQENWYSLILQAWMQAKPLPQTVEDASRLVTECLQSYPRADVLGILSFYGLPVPQEAPVSLPLPEGVIYQFQTLPVDRKAVVDGDGMTVYVSITERVFVVPSAVILLEFERAKAYEERDFVKAEKLSDAITVFGYRALMFNSVDYLARKYRLRLRGIDAPESNMPYGEEARVGLVNIVGGKCLRVLVYEEDRYGRLVADLYCDGVFVQEVMLRNGHAWHYSTYDKRIHFAEWEKEAKQKGIGLWASPKPEKPWDWRSRGKM